MHLPSNSFAQLNFQFEGLGSAHRMEITMGLEKAGGDFDSDALSDIVTEYGDNVLPHQSEAIELVNTVMKVGPNETGPTFELGTAAAGGTGAQSLPANVAALVQKVTGVGGRKGRGRFYLPGIAETVVTNSSVLDSTFQTALQNGLNAFEAGVNGAGFDLVLLHAEPPTAPYTINALLVQSRVATQRKRLR